MRRYQPLVVPIAGVALLTVVGYAHVDQPPGDRPEAAEKPVKIHLGMSPEDVRQQLGKPARIARQILYSRHVEQWFYQRPVTRWINFDCTKGEEPHVLTVHESLVPNR
jgi:hypothetical protein